MKYILCWLFLVSGWAIADEDKVLAKELLSTYFEMMESTDVKIIESFFDLEFTQDLKHSLKRKCGIVCLLNMSDRWKADYEKYILDSMESRRIFNVVNYKVTSKTNAWVVVELYKRSCDGQRSKEILEYVRTGAMWKISAVSFGSFSDIADSSEKVNIADICKDQKEKLKDSEI